MVVSLMISCSGVNVLLILLFEVRSKILKTKFFFFAIFYFTSLWIIPTSIFNVPLLMRSIPCAPN